MFEGERAITYRCKRRAMQMKYIAGAIGVSNPEVRFADFRST